MFMMCVEAHYICMVKHEFQHIVLSFVQCLVIIQICFATE